MGLVRRIGGILGGLVLIGLWCGWLMGAGPELQAEKDKARPDRIRLNGSSDPKHARGASGSKFRTGNADGSGPGADGGDQGFGSPDADAAATSLAATVQAVDAAILAEATKRSLQPIGPADDLRVMRRLSLALVGTIPSLEEIRVFESLPAADRLDRWTERLLADPRFDDYFAERLARTLVPSVPAEPFFVFRRRRFADWLAKELRRNAPWDELVRTMITAEGVWTDRPEANFITGHVNEEKVDAVRLANRTTRAFLGLRIDCAQCHDHPFAEWKQADFHGLAAFFGQTNYGLRGVREDQSKRYEYEDLKTNKPVVVEPKTPYLAEACGTEGDRRRGLAQWVTDPRNRHFARAISARLWALMFGQALTDPVDDLERPHVVAGLVDLLADDFRAHGHDLKRTLRIIASTAAFRRGSVDDPAATANHEKRFACFPMSRLRSEQIAGGLVQMSSLRTMDDRSEVLFRLIGFFNQNDFVNDFGDAGEEELLPRGGNITQRLLVMNGEIARNRGEANPALLTATARIARLAPDDRTALEALWLTLLTRRPTEPEIAHFLKTVENTGGDDRLRAFEDVTWALLNSTEAAWNH